MPELDSKERFGNRVDNYVKFRPSYPMEAIDCIAAQTHVNERSVIADIGSGTGKFTRLLLERGLNILAIEPNDNMREAAEKELSDFSGFRSVSANAEKTTLDDNSVDLITVAQAFHWFDRDVCKTEFKRILKPDGHVCLIWNRRETTPGFMSEYSDIIKRLYDDYAAGSAQEHITPAVFNDFFDGHYKIHNFFWHEPHDFDGLWGRSLSNSHAPVAGYRNYEPLRAALRDLFDKYNENGVVQFAYKTEVVIGQF